jgi:two-component system, LytTR family, sensor kinase
MEIRSKWKWLFRYRLYHIPFWFLYNYLWWAVAKGSLFGVAGDILHTPYSIKFSFYVIFQALAVCFNLYFLIPRFLEKSKFIAYSIYLAITILFASVAIIPGYYLSAILSGRTLESMYGPGSASFSHFFANSLPSTMASMTLAMSIKLTMSWIQTKRRQQLLEKEKLETELKFLKNQFNPHFLFNTINSIFFLIHKTPDLASDSLAKFSELLRYQLYECNDLQIPLNKEMAYLENFIELEKLRQNDNVAIYIQMNRQHAGHLEIAPFILMTLVENAFKHVSKHTDKPNWIKISLNLEHQQLDFTASNSTSLYVVNDVVHYGGIGLKNMQRRLDLIYSGKYNLDIQRKPDSFEVRLQLNLAGSVAHQTMERSA